MEFNPDFSEEPSWMKKNSLSSLSSSENLELSSKGPENSENWLIVKDQHSAPLQCPPKSNNDTGASYLGKSYSRLASEIVEPEETQGAMLHEPQTETSDLPSMYWKRPIDAKSELARSNTEVPDEVKQASKCTSYVAGHVEFPSYCFQNSQRPRLSDIASSSQSSSSVASTVRENSDFPRYDSILAEPQLSSTREITDDCVELAASYKDPNADRIKTARDVGASLPLLEMPQSPSFAHRSAKRVDSSPGLQNAIEILAQSVIDGNGSVHDLQNMVQHLDKEYEKELQGQAKVQQTANDRTGLSIESLIAVFSNTSALSTPLLMTKIKDHVLRLRAATSVIPSDSSGIGGSGFDSHMDHLESSESRFPSDATCQATDVANIRDSLADVYNGCGSTATSAPVIPTVAIVPATPVAAQPASDRPFVKTPVANSQSLKERHTFSTMPTHSTPTVGQQRPKMGTNGLKTGQEFAHVTSTVIKKVPPPEFKVPAAPKAKASLMEQRLANAPVVKCNRSHVFFGGAQAAGRRRMLKQQVVLRNSSFKESLQLELRIKDGAEFQLLDENQATVSRRVLLFEPRQECSVDLAFQPANFGNLTTKLNLYPRCGSPKNLKYTVDLSGYGGCSQINILVPNSSDKILTPKANGHYWSAKFALENVGKVAAFSYIHPSYGTPYYFISIYSYSISNCILIKHLYRRRWYSNGSKSLHRLTSVLYSECRPGQGVPSDYPSGRHWQTYAIQAEYFLGGRTVASALDEMRRWW